MVAENGQDVVGYMIYELHKKKLELIKLAVAPGFQRKGVGTQLLKKIQSKLSGYRRTRVGTYINEQNLPAQLFFKANNWVATRVERDFYQENDDSAIRFLYKLPILEPTV